MLQHVAIPGPSANFSHYLYALPRDVPLISKAIRLSDTARRALIVFASCFSMSRSLPIYRLQPSSICAPPRGAEAPRCTNSKAIRLTDTARRAFCITAICFSIARKLFIFIVQRIYIFQVGIRFIGFMVLFLVLNVFPYKWDIAQR